MGLVVVPQTDLITMKVGAAAAGGVEAIRVVISIRVMRIAFKAMLEVCLLNIIHLSTALPSLSSHL